MTKLIAYLNTLEDPRPPTSDATSAPLAYIYSPDTFPFEFAQVQRLVI